MPKPLAFLVGLFLALPVAIAPAGCGNTATVGDGPEGGTSPAPTGTCHFVLAGGATRIVRGRACLPSRARG